MEKCLSLERGVLGLGALAYYGRSEFREISKHIINKIPSLINENNNEKKILELNYEALDFCEKKNNKINEIQCLTGGRKISGECDVKCSNKINEYNVWISNEKVSFNKKKELLKYNCKNSPSHFPTEKCNILKSQNIVNSPPNDKVPTKEVIQDSLEGPTQTKEKTTEDQEKQPVSQPVTHVSPSDATSSSQSKSAEIQNIQSEPDTTSKASSQPENEASLSPGSNILQNSVSQITMAPSSTETISSHSETSLPSLTSANSNGPPKIL
ncbi:hypothetical protein PMALA_036960, partial [Plasmodium malariae]